MNDGLEDDAVVVDMVKQELVATKNPETPFDLNTPYGQYACIQAVLTHYNNKLRLHKLVRKPDVDSMKDAEVLQLLLVLGLWHRLAAALGESGNF